MRKRIFLLLFLLCLAMLTACSDMDDDGPSTPDSPPQSDGPLVEPIPTPAGLVEFSLPYFTGETMDPVTCADGPHQAIGALLYEGLYALDECFEPQPMLAKSFTYDAETLVYGVTLRSGVTFSDGTPLTSDDVAATLERARWSARYGGRLSDVTSVNAAEDTVYIALSRPNASFIARLDIPIVKSGTENDPVPVGTGRYVWQEENGAAFLTVNEHNWRSEKLPIHRIALVPCKDMDAMAYAFFSRKVQLVVWDLTGTVPFNASGANSYTDVPTAVMQYVGFNTGSRLFSNPALRSALSLGIDRENCVSACLLGHGEAAAFPVSPSSRLYPASLERRWSSADFAAAMAEAGYDTGIEHPVTMIVSAGNAFRVGMAQQIAERLSAYDVKITVKALPWGEFQQALTVGNYDLYYAECKLPSDWDLSALLAENGALNFSHYTDEELPELLYAAATSSGGRREVALRSLYVHLQEKAPFVPVCFKNVSVLLPQKAVELQTPTAADPFFGLADWAILWADAES
ncbi:MAG: ABC transporter substrate-binding protein [Oscillospiraceae bacterium]|nr:ABC transporter substrate-binding protein [Oscillospiraceae bacterium]